MLRIKIPSHREMIEGFDIVDPEKLTPQQNKQQPKAAYVQQKQDCAGAGKRGDTECKVSGKENMLRPHRRITAVTDDCPHWLPNSKSSVQAAMHPSSHPVRRRLTATTDDHPQYAEILVECRRLGVIGGCLEGRSHSSSSSGPASPTSDVGERPPARYRRITATTDSRHWLDDALEVDTLSAPGTPRAA